MKFKELRENIFSPCKVISPQYPFDREKSPFIDTYKESEYDEYEVIGIRSRYNLGFDYIEVNLK